MVNTKVLRDKNRFILRAFISEIKHKGKSALKKTLLKKNKLKINKIHYKLVSCLDNCNLYSYWLIIQLKFYHWYQHKLDFHHVLTIIFLEKDFSSWWRQIRSDFCRGRIIHSLSLDSHKSFCKKKKKDVKMGFTSC
jgi:hypothetical protein